MKFRLSAPGKTFLIGEYAALERGPAILLNTGPRFILRAQTDSKKSEILGFSHLGPVAGILKESSFSSMNLIFEDPYQGLGGFGASGAQFLLLFALMKLVRGETFIERDLLAAYQNSLPRDTGRSPSGYDLLAQMMGKVCFVHRNLDTVTSQNWPRFGLDFILIRTGLKTLTHEHLRDLNPLNVKALSQPVVQAKLAMDHCDGPLLIESILEFRKYLEELGLVASKTKELVSVLEQIEGVEVAKGCGAMGADVICVLVESISLPTVLQSLRAKNLEVVATSESLSEGFVFHSQDIQLMQELSP